MRLTIACPEAHIEDANHLAMVLGYSEADARTYREPVWQDAVGNLYAAASLPVSDGFVDRAFGPLTRPEWDVQPYTVNMTGAGRAQDALKLGQPGDMATPLNILAMPGDDGPAALAAMGLTPIPTEI